MDRPSEPVYGERVFVDAGPADRTVELPVDPVVSRKVAEGFYRRLATFLAGAFFETVVAGGVFLAALTAASGL